MGTNKGEVKLIRKEKRKEKGRKEIKGEREREREKITKKGASASLSDLRKSEGWFSLEQEVKLIHTTRAMRGYQNLRVSSNSKR